MVPKKEISRTSGMSLRAPAEHENQRISLDVAFSFQIVLPAHAGIQVYCAEMTWIPAGVDPDRGGRAGTTEPGRLFCCTGIFEGEDTEDRKILSRKLSELLLFAPSW